MSEPASAAHDARRRRALPLPVIGSAVAILVIVVAAAGLLVYLDRRSSKETEASLASAQAMYEKGDFSGAENALDAIVKEDAGDLDARRVLAQTLAAEGKNDEAIDEYKVVIKGDPKDDASLYALGSLEQLLGDAQGSIGHYERAVAVQPEPDYLAALAAVYATVGRWGDCVKTWDQYLQSAELDAPEQGRVYDSIASAYENAREYDKAKTALEQALSFDPNNQQYKARLEAYEG